VIVLPIIRTIGDMAAEAHGRRVARWVIWTCFAGSLLAILTDEQARLGRLRETPTGEVWPYAPEADARSRAGKIGCPALTITRNADPGGEGASPLGIRPKNGMHVL
jgi:hypothetical protein